MNFFNLLKKKKTEEVTLSLRYHIAGIDADDGIATDYYNIVLNDNLVIGHLDLRLSSDEDIYYYGHIGYHIFKLWRGHHYAYYACQKAFEIARDKYHYDHLLITCSPDNIASYKTLIKLEGELIETVDVPINHDLYRRGEKVKCIFRFKL